MEENSGGEMRVTVTTMTGKIANLDVPEELPLRDFKALCQSEVGIQANIAVVFNGRECPDDAKNLKDYGIKDGEMVFVQATPSSRPPPPTLPAAAAGASPLASGGGPLAMPDFSKIKIPKSGSSELGGPSPGTSSGGPSSGGAVGGGSSRQSDDPAVIRDMLRANPDQLALLKQNNPRLAEALESGNLDEFGKVLKEQQEARAERERQRLRMLTADPMDMEAQRLIAQEIENKNIEQNMELAMEYNPESFGTVVMLYIDCKVNGHHIKAFVDSGAQATIMSQRAAERCNIMRLVDRRWAGIAKGVGTQKIIGRVHLAQIQIQDDFLPSAFSILEEQPMDMLLGLDMLKRHQCSIDLKNNVLIFGSTGTTTPFLAEADLPECARLSSAKEPAKEEDVDQVMQDSAKEQEDRMIAEALEQSKAEEEKRKSQSPPEETAAAAAAAAAPPTPPTATTPAAAVGTQPSSVPVAAAAAAATSAAAAVDPHNVQAGDKFTEDDVKTLVTYGFPRELCIAELRAKNGNVRDATAALFARSLKF